MRDRPINATGRTCLEYRAAITYKYKILNTNTEDMNFSKKRIQRYRYKYKYKFKTQNTKYKWKTESDRLTNATEQCCLEYTVATMKFAHSCQLGLFGKFRMFIKN